MNKVKGAKDKESLVAFLGWMTGGEKISRAEAAEKARAFLAECGGNAEGVVRFAEEAKPSYALMAGKLALPLDQFEMEAEREAKKQAGNPVFKVLFPALNNVRPVPGAIRRTPCPPVRGPGGSGRRPRCPDEPSRSGCGRHL